MSRHALAPLPASDALRHDKLQLTAAHSRHNKTLATLTRAAGASRAAWTSSGLSQSLYVFYGECESNAQQYGTLAMSSQPAEQDIHFSTHEASDSEGGQTVMTKSGRQNRGWLNHADIIPNHCARYFNSHLVPRTSSKCTLTQHAVERVC